MQCWSVPPAAAEGTGYLFTYAGGDRVATAVAVSQGAYPGGAERVYLARSDSFPDALTGASLGGGPLLLVPPDGPVPGAVITEVNRLAPALVVAFGGPGALSDTVIDQIAGTNPWVRLGGATRFDTAVEISRFGYVGGADVVYLARADDFADALSAGSVQDGPVLLVPSAGPVPVAVGAEIARLDPLKVIALGGEGAISTAVLQQAAGGRPTERLAGGDRYATAVAIARHAWGTATGLIPVVVSGANFPDGLAAGGIDKGPVLLVPPCGELPVGVDIALQTAEPRSLAVIGGPAAICPELVGRIAAAAGVTGGGADLDELDDADQSSVIARTWDRPIRYRFAGGTRDLADWQGPIRRAMDSWEAAAAVAFVPAGDGPVDVTIGFVQGCHHPNVWGHSCFDGQGPVLAHATLGDGTPAHNYLHFDDGQVWVDDPFALPPAAFDLETVALHELGHVLGINHLPQIEAVMHESYFEPRRTLSVADVVALHALYP